MTFFLNRALGRGPTASPWGRGDPIREELFSVERLEEHARSLAVAQQVAQQCSNGGWSPLFKSYADCTKHYGVALNDATNAGKGIGIAIIVAIWVVLDFFLGLGYGIYKLATR